MKKFKLSTNILYPIKIFFQKWRWIKDIFSPSSRKSERMCCQRTNTIGNTKGTFSGWREMVADESIKEIKNTRKVKYVGKSKENLWFKNSDKYAFWGL